MALETSPPVRIAMDNRNMGSEMKKTPLERFMDKVEMEPMSGCWLWTGCTKKGPKCSQYGWFGLDGRNYNAHRASWILHNGPIESPMTLVCHRCDNPSCVNPTHLFLGSHTDNNRDCVLKGRHVPGKVKGVQHPSSKLTEQNVLCIRELLSKGYSQHVISNMYGVAQTTISAIKRRVIWSLLHD